MGRPGYGTVAKPRNHFTEGMFEKCCKRRSAKGARSLLFPFRASFGHLLVTFSDASVTFLSMFCLNSFCHTPFAAG